MDHTDLAATVDPTLGADLSALDLAAAIRRRELSIPEVTAAALRRAEADELGAFVHLAPEHALPRAQELQEQLDRADFEPGPLFGVPLPIKDLNQVAGMPTRFGTTAIQEYRPQISDGIVTLLGEAGTVAIGKTSTPEFGLPCYTEPENQPPARTPYDPTRIAGGSSGGAAVAVASGIVPIAQASDGGGSIRIPAACCGLVGLKPSRGRISPGPLSVDGVALASAGVLTRTVRDTAAALDVLSERWPGDTFTAPAEASFLAACDVPVAPLRIGVLTDPVIDAAAQVHPEAKIAVAKVAKALEEAGHHLSEAPVPFEAELWGAFEAIWAVGSLGAPVKPENEHLLRPLTRWLREKGRTVTGEAYAAAVSSAQQTTRLAATTWADFDVVIMPTLAQPPAKIGALRNDADPARDFIDQTRFTPWTSVFNITGWPAISLPVHTAPIDGVELPFGVMLTGKLFDEARLLALAAHLEAAGLFAR